MASDQSVPLSRALERFSDPSDWHELRSLESYATTMFVLGAPETDYQRLHWRYRSLKERLEAEFRDKLIAGTLVATGELHPVRLDPERVVIPRRRWQELQPDFAALKATGGGLRIVNIEVAPSSDPRAADASVPRAQASLAKLRADLRRWLEREALARGPSWYKSDYREAARSEFGDLVTDNLFDEVWRFAELPGALREPGLRKKRHFSTGSSPPD